MGNGGDIIIKGGSIDIAFDENTFTGKDGKYGNKEKKIASVEVVDDESGQKQTVNIPANGKCTIRVNTR